MAQGSQKSYGGWEPRTCCFGDLCVCGGKIVRTHEHALRFHHDDVTGESRSWHVACEKEHGWPT